MKQRSRQRIIWTLMMIIMGGSACDRQEKTKATASRDSMVSCEKNLPVRFPVAADTTAVTSSGKATHEGMVWIAGGSYPMGAADEEGRPDEYPQHTVRVDGFYMDTHEVTNGEFRKFVSATGYITTAERAPEWSELKKQLPPGTPKPADTLLVAASLVFSPPSHAVSLDDASQWWSWKKGANWRHPLGPGSDLKGKDHYPVVQVSWDDAAAYAKWAGRRLPTEAEWEYAARGGLKNTKYPWGNEEIAAGRPRANTFQGHFPDNNTDWDRYDRVAPVGSFAANGYGLYDMAGNVWEWCEDWYRADAYGRGDAGGQRDRGGKAGKGGKADKGDEAGKVSAGDKGDAGEKVIRGGSFLCNAVYCKGYRVSSRMKTSPDTGMEHTGFRTVSK